ncbi:hypothetical protein F2Q68_00014122 [Brassica cretica]|uniref:Uncharacterized protein n=1 Tax=Brassica cretica TaxID=69181 RepID=A0A8S9HJN6_BRACR|nr:hypothetical protein F2Q68_00014122 [Brassica cretica]
MAHPIVTPSSFLPNIPIWLVALSLDAIENLTYRCLLLTTHEALSVSLFLLTGNVWWPKLLHLNRVFLLGFNYPPGVAAGVDLRLALAHDECCSWPISMWESPNLHKSPPVLT